MTDIVLQGHLAIKVGGVSSEDIEREEHKHSPMSRKTRMAMATMKEVFPYSAMVFTIRDLKIWFHLRGSHDQELVNSPHHFA